MREWRDSKGWNGVSSPAGSLPPDKAGLRRNFRRRAATYEQYAQVQRAMAGELLRLAAAPAGTARRILEVGCGTGTLTRELRRLNPTAWLVAVDLDPEVLRRARAALSGDRRTSWLAMDAEALCRGEFELIIANSVFQWFSRPRETLARYHGMLASGGLLAFSAMGPATFRELGQAWREAVLAGESSPPVPVAATFPAGLEWVAMLHQAGFREVCLSRELKVVSYPSVLDFLKAVQGTGAVSPRPRPLTPRQLRRLLMVYHSLFGNGVVPATYELLYLTAGK
ncbi:MAG: methyltransferase [Syntrophobacterales bacterium]|nr:methyltransferase [Syntrophobacterales bacterium]